MEKLAGKNAKVFLDTYQDGFLNQLIKNFARVCGNEQPSVLNLVFTQNMREIDNIEYIAPIGSSNHVALTFDFLTETKI